MTDDHRAPEAIASGFAGLAEGIRTDMRAMEERLRDDAEKAEERVIERVVAVEAGQKDTRAFIETFAVDHGKDHEAEATERRNKYSEFHNFIRQFELDEARRAGALGVIRWGFELLSRHSARVVAVILAMAAAAGIATGNIEVAVGQ